MLTHKKPILSEKKYGLNCTQLEKNSESVEEQLLQLFS
jgi:hypothetical protein